MWNSRPEKSIGIPGGIPLIVPWYGAVNCPRTGGYVVSVTVGDETLGNNNTSNTFAAPCRDGYVFAGWATSSGSGEIAYSAEQIAEVPEGTTLYAVWEEPSAEPEEPEEPADSAESTEEG